MGTARGAARIVARTVVAAEHLVRAERPRLVHSRGYFSTMVAQALKRSRGLPYLFDPRGYWIEERSGTGGRLSGATYAVGKFVEQVLFRDAHAVVTLTDLQANDVASGLFGPPPARLTVIPTCADYDAFALRDARQPELEEGEGVPETVRRRLSGKVVVGVVGSINATYHVEETLALARLATQISPAAHLLVLSNQEAEYEAALRSIGLPSDRYTLASAEHRAMPMWLRWIDWGLLLVPETIANRAKMPTKLAEFFAAGVRPMFYGCNSDVATWVKRAGSGHVLPSIDENALVSAAHTMTESAFDHEKLRAAREITAPHFSLASGVERYFEFVSACLSG